MAKHTQTEIHNFTGYSRDAIRTRFIRFGLDKRADPREVLVLKPLDETDKSGTLEEARMRQAEADAHLKELQAEKLQAVLAPVEEVRAEITTLLDQLSAVIRKSPLDEEDKQDCLVAMSDIAKKW